MHSKEKKVICIRSLIVLFWLIFLAIPMVAQQSSSASASTSIVLPDNMARLSLTSEDGTLFMLSSGIYSCFDLSIAGLPLSLSGKNGENEVCYKLDVVQKTSASIAITNIRLNVLFKEVVGHGTYLAASPYTILVNYN